MPQPAIDALAIAFERHSAALLGVGLQLGLQSGQLRERRVWIRHFLAPFETRRTLRLLALAIAMRPVGAMLAAKMLAATRAAVALARMAVVPRLALWRRRSCGGFSIGRFAG